MSRLGGERHLDIKEALYRGLKIYYTTMWHVKLFFYLFF